MAYKILVVDDDESIRQLLGQLLKMQGYEDVKAVSSGMAALDYLLHSMPDLMLLDVDMPDMDGWLLCEIVNKIDRWKHLPIIFQSALVGAENIRRGIDLGAHGYIEKPYTSDNISEVLHSVFEEKAPEAAHAPAEIGMVVREVAESAKHTFNLLLGTPTEVIEAVEVRSRTAGESFSFVGKIKAEGMTDIEISTGFSQNFAMTASQALTQMEPEDLDDELVLDSLQEILNMMLGTAIRTVGKTFPVQLTVPQGAEDAAIPYNDDSPHVYRLTVRAGKAIVPVVVTVG